MRRIRIYQPDNFSVDQEIILNSEATRHLVQVLRKNVGDNFFIFNGKGGEFSARIISVDKKSMRVSIEKFHDVNIESSLSIHLGQALSRGERMDFAIQKSVELGVTEITPLFTEYTQVKLDDTRMSKRVLHWQAIAIASAEQSGRCIVPVVHEPILFSEWITKKNEIKQEVCTLRNSPCATGDSQGGESRFSPLSASANLLRAQHQSQEGVRTQCETPVKMICCPHRSSSLNAAQLSIASVALTIGPEGGFSDAEIDSAVQKNFKILSLGPRVLRTETATIVALTVLQSRWGDIRNTNFHNGAF